MNVDDFYLLLLKKGEQKKAKKADEIKELHEQLVNRIHELRTERGISVNTLASQSGVAQASINNILHGESKVPGLWLLCRIAKGFGITVSELLEGVDLALEED